MIGVNRRVCLIDYTAVNDRLRKGVLDAKVVRGMCEESTRSLYAVLARIKLKGHGCMIGVVEGGRLGF